MTGGQTCALPISRFPPGSYSALAGFFEVGESIEEAVTRELREEAGIIVHNVRYVASQPWPFPSSLMIGCFADAQSPELNLDTQELEDAFWARSEEHTSELQSLMRISYAVFCLKKKKHHQHHPPPPPH